ncbi:hypothetical protein EYF80_014610 [Liparis tanakae]|uniref:Uncharacterized protein n=1 Tax=Liparis tanakae TaxID=230148 RepID=A0A4Z2IBD1_9TELE|nr:hypothetical protein EYF80_014610 [Liparis tanakae]
MGGNSEERDDSPGLGCMSLASSTAPLETSAGVWIEQQGQEASLSRRRPGSDLGPADFKAAATDGEARYTAKESKRLSVCDS